LYIDVSYNQLRLYHHSPLPSSLSVVIATFFPLEDLGWTLDYCCFPFASATVRNLNLHDYIDVQTHILKHNQPCGILLRALFMTIIRWTLNNRIL
jgi:hypothetical protein